MWGLYEGEGYVEGPQVTTKIEEWCERCVRELKLAKFELLDVR